MENTSAFSDLGAHFSQVRVFPRQRLKNTENLRNQIFPGQQ
jgi:hypothetical protein